MIKNLFKKANSLLKQQSSLFAIKNRYFKLAYIPVMQTDMMHGIRMNNGETNRNLLDMKHNFFWGKKNDKGSKDDKEKSDSSEDKPPKGFEKFYRKKKTDDSNIDGKEQKESKSTTDNESKGSNPQEPKKGKFCLTF